MGLAWLTGCGRNFRSGAGGAAVALAVLLGSGTPTRAGLVITPTYDASITNDPNSAAIINVIQSAINFYQSAFSDPINVTIRFQEMTSGLGQSNYTLYKLPYQTFINALTADATSANDATALAHLPTGATNPVTGSTTINLHTANIRALAIPGSFPPIGGVDGVIGLNTHITDIGSPGTTGQYSLFAVVEHEIDEVLGLGSDVGDTGFFADPVPQDLFRYDSAGNRNYTTAGDNAYFSINTTTRLAQFNQSGVGDYGDWKTGAAPPQVQDAFATPGAHPVLTLGSPEVTALDVLGYTLATPAAVPEPGTLTLLGAGGLFAAAYGWRRRRPGR